MPFNNEKMKITIDTGPGGELREHWTSRQTVEKILSMAATALTQLRAKEGNLPPTEAEALRTIRDIQHQWKMA
jgi:hypothetical protein